MNTLVCSGTNARNAATIGMMKMLAMAGVNVIGFTYTVGFTWKVLNLHNGPSVSAMGSME